VNGLIVNERLEVHSSRLWALLHFSFTRLLFPAHMIADHIGISTNIVRFWLTPWRRTDEHLPMSHIAEVAHTRGLIWDRISVESSGGLNPFGGRGPAEKASPLFCRARARAPQRNHRYAATATTSPLNLSPSLPAEITTFSPSLMRPERIISASGSCTDFWITRLSGRAP
jgi:hypothetical protein